MKSHTPQSFRRGPGWNGTACLAAMVLALLTASPASADLAEALQLAGCAGVADAEFVQVYRHMDDPKQMDAIADEAHIFFVLARQAGGAGSAVLHLERLRARDKLLQLKDDDAQHTIVQACSDLRQQLTRDGRFTE